MHRQSRFNDHADAAQDIVNADGMDETYGTYADDACFYIHDYPDDTDHDTDDETDADTHNDINERLWYAHFLV